MYGQAAVDELYLKLRVLPVRAGLLTLHFNGCIEAVCDVPELKWIRSRRTAETLDM